MTMSPFDWSFLDPLGRAVIAAIETVISLSAITSVLSLLAALVATWVMQVTTHQAGLGTPSARLALAQRIALAALAIFLMLNAVTPFITPDPPWLANLPLVVAIMAFLLAFGLSHIRAERARAAEAIRPEAEERSSNGPHEPISPG
jgi:divalent metal cation (Fe/Co/Zn/Cd) transporter